MNSGVNSMRHRYLAVLTASASFAMLLTSVHISLADAIDGDWCKADGKRMKIRGPEIVTPGGNQTRGDYTRHSFSYVVPPGEAGAGESVSITLLSEYLAHARQGSDTAPIQVWNRCPPGVADTRPVLTPRPRSHAGLVAARRLAPAQWMASGTSAPICGSDGRN
jgi:hypothetical protein